MLSWKVCPLFFILFGCWENLGKNRTFTFQSQNSSLLVSRKWKASTQLCQVQPIWLSWGGVSFLDAKKCTMKSMNEFLCFLFAFGCLTFQSPLKVLLWFYWILTLVTLYIPRFRWPFFTRSVQIVWPDPHSYYWSHNCYKNYQRSMTVSLCIKFFNSNAFTLINVFSPLEDRLLKILPLKMLYTWS
jgi:hypothetical protein